MIISRHCSLNRPLVDYLNNCDDDLNPIILIAGSNPKCISMERWIHGHTPCFNFFNAEHLSRYDYREFDVVFVMINTNHYSVDYLKIIDHFRMIGIRLVILWSEFGDRKHDITEIDIVIINEPIPTINTKPKEEQLNWYLIKFMNQHNTP